jgi:hypothetical protein
MQKIYIVSAVFNSPAPSPCEDNNTEPFPKTPVFYDIGHIWLDLRPFLHTESFQILDILGLHLWSALSIQTTGFQVQRPRWPLQNVDFIWSINNFFMDFDVCLGLLSCWKIYLRPSFSLLAETTRFWLKCPGPW